MKQESSFTYNQHCQIELNSSEVLDDIKFFTLDCHMGARIQYRLLTAKYPNIYIFPYIGL